MHQAGVFATSFQHLRHDRFLADVALGDAERGAAPSASISEPALYRFSPAHNELSTRTSLSESGAKCESLFMSGFSLEFLRSIAKPSSHMLRLEDIGN
jgi:hypothetical protein